MNVTKFCDEIRLAVICQTNLVIAGSPRNSFWTSVVI